MNPYIRSVFKSAFSQKALHGNFLAHDKARSQSEASSFDDQAMDEYDQNVQREILMLTQEELVVYPGEFHGIATPSYNKDLLERYLDWYGKYIKGIEPAAAAEGGGE